METCKRCGYEWKSRIADPRICPQCKSKKWKEEKIRKWEEKKDEGYIYCLLFSDDIIKVGKSTDPYNRILTHNQGKKIKFKFISHPCFDCTGCENMVIEESNKICGQAINDSREYFSGTHQDYIKIVSAIKSIVGKKKLVTERTIKQIKEDTEL